MTQQLRALVALRTWVQFKASTWHITTMYKPSSRDYTPFSDLEGQCMYVVIFIHAGKTLKHLFF